jgi:hypothetical protein
MKEHVPSKHRKVTILNVGQETSYPDSIFVWFSQSLRAKASTTLIQITSASLKVIPHSSFILTVSSIAA